MDNVKSLGGFILFVLLLFPATTCLGDQSLSEMKVSFQCNGNSLAQCINTFEDKSHIRVFFPTDYKNSPVNINMSEVPFSTIFEEIASQVHLKNYTLKFDDNLKTIYFSSIGGSTTITNNAIGTVPLEISNIPHPSIDGKIPTTSDTKLPQDPAFSKDDVEIFPPSPTGEHGMTLKELRKFEATLEKNKKDPLDMEALPPTEPGGKGITKRQLDNDNAKRELNESPSFEAFPPSQPGEKGLTLDQINAQRQNDKFQPPQTPFPSSEKNK